MTDELAPLFEAFRLHDDYDTSISLIAALRQKGRIDEAIDLFTTVTARDFPAECLANYASLGCDLALYDQSIALFNRAIPNLSTDINKYIGKAGLSQALFSSGRYHEGHPLFRALRDDYWYSISWQLSFGGPDYWWKPYHDRLLFDQPVAGKRIMVFGEAGIGDFFQMIRYTDALKREGASRVIVSAPGFLKNLIQTKDGVEVVTDLLPETEWDYFSPILSLYARYQTHPFAPHWAEGYLAADAKSRFWNAPPPRGADRPRVGVVWRSNTTVRHEPFRSMPLSTLAPLLGDRSIDWCSIQVDATDEERSLLAHFNVEDVGGAIKSFDDTARVLQGLDLLISIDSAPVHLAGAMGRPVWVLLSGAPDYRWCNDQRFTPWYDSARLFRQKRIGDWSSVLEDLSQQLRAL